MDGAKDTVARDVVFFAPTEMRQVQDTLRAHGPDRIALVLDPDRTDLVLGAVRAGARAIVAHVPDGSGATVIARKLARGEAHVDGAFAVTLLEVARDLATRQPAALDLTARERGILELVALGEANRVIASRLFLSEHTVRNHLARIFRKLDVTSRDEAAQALRDEGGSRAAGRADDGVDGSPIVPSD